MKSQLFYHYDILKSHGICTIFLLKSGLDCSYALSQNRIAH
uniref:Uncharacterized protein n=1 Tax=Phage sp. ctrsQ3 TaxID=2826752 RepID=A0A8S5MG93_9VIRU|nr:MAG TPA: hypothetical protein [Phage sp. ctrsQ3]